MKYVESPQLELKEQINGEFKKEIIAFANTDGGEIYVGIARDGSITGITDPESEMEKIGNMIRDGIKPDLTAYTSIERVEDDGKALIRVSVSRGLKRPYHLTDKGLKPAGVFVRHGVSSVPATDEAIRQMLRESDGTTFDKMRSINQELTFEYAEKTFQTSQVAFDAAHKRTLGLIDVDGYYTNAALLLSDQCGHIIRCAVYEGTGKNKFKTRKEFSGSILKQMDDAYSFLSLNNNLRATFDGLRRIDHADYPEEAMREALVNAVVHRDYDYSGSIIINIYDDRMEFISLGGLVKGLTLADIRGGVSQPRNAVIANVFYRLELIESYGTGIQKIMESYAGCGIEPMFAPAPASFVVTLPNRNTAETTASDPGLSREENILRLMAKQGAVTRKDVEQLLGCSSFPANKALAALVEQGKIMKTGAARGTKYVLK
ncbi:MAG: AAA family ATPase [Oscillospiraceae bacterium]|jgi:ATP-dependent DNA helicase RecG|nr:AAA family ATPase [Oscillospiraceae bacterium]